MSFCKPTIISGRVTSKLLQGQENRKIKGRVSIRREGKRERKRGLGGNQAGKRDELGAGIPLG
jgi:hypothetical protein